MKQDYFTLNKQEILRTIQKYEFLSQEQLKEILHQLKDKTGDPRAGFNASSFFLGGDGRHLMIPCLYRGKKGKKGSEDFTSSYKEMLVYAKFCPFSGKPLYDDSNEADA